MKLYSRAMDKAKKVMRKPNADFLRKGRGAALKNTFIKEQKEEEEICIAIPLKVGRVPVSDANGTILLTVVNVAAWKVGRKLPEVDLRWICEPVPGTNERWTKRP